MDFIKTDIDSRGILTIELNRPEVHNAFNAELIEEISSVFENISNVTRLIILKGSGKSFCSGADLNWMKSMKDYSEEENFKDSKNLARMFRVINNCEVPVIGKINGHALGGGVGLVSVCDYCHTTSKAKFGFTEVKLGLIPAVISPFVIKKIGESMARATFMSGEVFSADKALEMNLVHRVSESSNFERDFEETIEMFLLAAPDASKKSKKLIFEVLDKERNEIEDYTCRAIAQKRISDEGQEGMSALLEKRKANWIKND